MRPRKGIYFDCEYCGEIAYSSQSKHKRKKRHFCSMNCYSEFRKHFLPKEEQHAYNGGGMGDKERLRRIKVRRYTNHAIRDGRLIKKPCNICGSARSQAHHNDYLKPLDVEWLCFLHHQQRHGKLIHENPELL